MKYEVGNAPILTEGQEVIARIPGEGVDLLVNCKIVGRATADTTHHPMYLVQCTDGLYPNATYPYSTFSCPLGMIDPKETDNE